MLFFLENLKFSTELTGVSEEKSKKALFSRFLFICFGKIPATLPSTEPIIFEVLESKIK